MENKTIKKDKFGELNLEVYKNMTSERIFVHFSSEDGKLVLQKNYQDTIKGRSEAEKFEKSIKSLKDLKKYFRIK